MPFELRDSKDNSIIHSNDLTASDFEKGRQHEQGMDGQYNIVFPAGELNFNQWVFNGIRMAYSEYSFKERTELEWKGELEMVTMFFNIQGQFSLMGNGMERGFELNSNQHNLFFGQQAGGRMEIGELTMRTFMIQFTRDAFYQIARDGNDAIKRFMEGMDCGRSVSFSDQNLEMDLNIRQCIEAVRSCPYGDLKKMFLYSKAIELLVLQAEAYNRTLQPQAKYIRSDYDRERIIFARDYLIGHLEAPPSLTELARIAGINEFKLKRGFKEVFNQTVFGYLNDTRMELAKKDLLDRNKSVTEIAFELGYSSVQHFSAAFSKKYGKPPASAR